MMAIKKMSLIQVVPVILTVVCFLSCKSKVKKTTPVFDSLKTIVPTINKGVPQNTAVVKAPIINIGDTLILKKFILFAKDSAANNEGISAKLAQIYGVKIPGVLKLNKLKVTGAPIAWYTSRKAVYFFEAGFPIDKKPNKLPKNFFVKTIGGDSAVVAHFFGPYNITSMGYEALADWLKAKKKKKQGEPYEVYVGDPFDKNGKPVDPYRVQTDIIQAYK